MIERMYHNLDSLLEEGKVLIIYGARQVGKTTLLEAFLETTTLKYRLDTGDNLRIRTLLSSSDFDEILEYAAAYDLIAIDEAQEIENIGQALKIIVDHYPQIKVIATGSSSFNLSQKVGEPLTGRKITKILYPLSQQELLKESNRFELKERLEEFLLFGSYPEVVTAQSRAGKIRVLNELIDSYLLKDLFQHERIKSPRVLIQLLKMIAFQVGNEVSLNELSNKVGVDAKTIARYLDLLEKSFVIHSLGGFSRNLRKEVTSKRKYYFLDVGIRNALISQFNSFDNRDDLGALFENFCFMERIKKHEYEEYYGNHYYWRTYNGQEVDFVEECDGALSAFECKSSEKKEPKPPGEWTNSYKNSSFCVVNRKNYLDFVL
ncbi:MAG: AAA family ATPase [Candidatus Aegiribacteria sp.]|nr:AAA family ATPase [Candidatus Aegiribacteria sp.]